MQPWEAVWRVGVPLIVVAGAVVAVSIAFRDRPDQFSRPRAWQWAWVGIWLMAAGDAAFGDDRPLYERGWKGTVALLIAVAIAVATWRHYRWRRGARLANDGPGPVTPRPRSDS